MKKIFFILNIIIFAFFQNEQCLIVFPFKVSTYIPKDDKSYDITDLINEKLISNLYTTIEIGNPPQKVTSVIIQDQNSFSLSSEICENKAINTVNDLSIVNKKGLDLQKLNTYKDEFYDCRFKNYLDDNKNVGILYHNISIYNTTFLSCQPADGALKQGKIDSKIEVKNITMIIKDYEKNKKLCGIIGLGAPNRFPGGVLKLRDVPLFINTLKKENIIDNYSFSYKFYNRDEGRLILGALPHQYEYHKNYYSEEKFRVIKSHNPTNVDFPWSIRFDSIHYNNIKNETKYVQNPVTCFFSPNLGLIIGEETYKNLILEDYFQPLINKKICFLEKTKMTNFLRLNYVFATNGTFDVFHCNSSITTFGKNFPKLIFEFKEQNILFSLTSNDLFSVINDRYYFNIIFPDNYYNVKHSFWYLGIPFYKAYQPTFNFDSKTIGFYISKNMNNENDANKKIINNEEETGQKRSVKRTLLEIFFGICLVIVAYFIGKKINEQRKKRANELEDDYDYYTNKKTNLNDINENNSPNNNTEGNLEMTSALTY